MTCNIAVTGDSFAAVAADTRIALQHVDGQLLPFDTKESMESTGFPWPYPAPLLKIANVGHSWVTVCGDVFCGVPALQILKDASAESYEDARNALCAFDSWNICMPSGAPITESQKIETQVFGAPFKPNGAPIWHHTLNPSDHRNGRRYLSVIQWGAEMSPSEGPNYQDRLETLMTGRPSVHAVAQCMGEIIAKAATLSSTVSTYIHFGATFKKLDGGSEKVYFTGSTEELLRLSKQEFGSRLVRIP